VTGGPESGGPRSYKRVTFDRETFNDVVEVAASASSPTEEVTNNEWGVDGDDSPHPSTEHRERITWHLATSRILIRPTEEHYRVSCDMDLLPFQAKSYASDEEETEYLVTDLDGKLISGVKFELPEIDDDVLATTDDRPGHVHSTYKTYKAGLATQPDSIVRACEGDARDNQPQAAIETSCDTREGLLAPEIEFEFGEEPTIELSS